MTICRAHPIASVQLHRLSVKAYLIGGINSFSRANCFNNFWLCLKNRGHSLQLPRAQLTQLLGQAFEMLGCTATGVISSRLRL